LTASLIAGGKSNLTYELSDGASTWILRRPPLGHVLATAHDMGREYRVMTALQHTPVPVPATYAMCTDNSVLGAPFYVMERCVGTPYRRASELDALGRERAQVIAERLVDTMAALHRVDPAKIGLGDFGKADGYLARQVARWKKQMDASYNRDLPAADELYVRLAANVPAEGATGIVHGDFRLDNLLMNDDDQPTAVLDWEMATLGDPLADLALMLVYHRLGEALGTASVTDAALAKGFLSESDIVLRYATRTDKYLGNLGFYIGLAVYKLAAILEGIHFRYLQGQTVGEGFDRVGEGVHPLLESGLQAMKES
jgi:aminoglycoside phosphotransferase (APT) family kinase protein